MGHDPTHNGYDYNFSFAVGVILNIVFVAVEAGYGVYTGSLALITDSGHNLSDVIGLLLAWGAGVIAAKAQTETRTYGFRKVTVMASLVSAVLLLFALGGITIEAVGRFRNPAPVEGRLVIIVAAVGVVINGLTASLFFKGQKHDLNIRGAFLHMAADAGVSLGVVIAGIIILLKGWVWIDPLVSLIIVAVIFVGTWGLLRDSINYAIDAVPKRIHLQEVRKYLSSLEQVERIHDLHVWPLSTTEIALTVHLVSTGNTLDNRFLQRVSQHLQDHFGIAHATIQMESADTDTQCRLDASECKT